jgi:N-methylhydantoinase A/oxoprolinase/acetone carboxylase beta subunit
MVFPLAPAPLPLIERATGSAPAPAGSRRIYSTAAQDVREFSVFRRHALRAGDVIAGPAAIEEAGTTTIIETGDVLSIEAHGCLDIRLA